MGDYRFIDEKVNDDDGIIRTVDGVHIPNPGDDWNHDWRAYQTWLAVPNTPDTANDPGLAEVRRREKNRVDLEAEEQFILDMLAADGLTLPYSVAAYLWSIEDARRYERSVWAQVSCEDNATSQMVTANTWEPFESFDTDDDASDNASADQANDKVITGRRGVYRITGQASARHSVAGKIISIRATVGGAQAKGSVVSAKDVAGGDLVHLAFSVLVEVASDDQDVQLDIRVDSIGSLTVEHATLSIEKTAELDTAANYPFLDELVPDYAADRDAVAEALFTEWNGIKVRFGEVENIRRKAHADIDSAGTNAAIRAITPVWPATP